MKLTKIALITIFLILIGVVSYGWLTAEEWPARKKCEQCDQLESQKMKRLVGSVKIEADKFLLFTEQKTGKVFKLNPCDVMCGDNLNKWFGKMGFVDVATGKPFLFEIEGNLEADKNEFLLKSVIFLGEDEN